MVREEYQNNTLGPRQLYYYFDGMRIGDVGNNGKPPQLTDYVQQMAAAGSTQNTGLFRYGKPVASADFDENFQPINTSPTAAALAGADAGTQFFVALFGRDMGRVGGQVFAHLGKRDALQRGLGRAAAAVPAAP